MTLRCQLRITDADYDVLRRHLFPGDGDEHGAVLKAGLCRNGDSVRLLVREVALAREGSDYVPGTLGYRALHPSFIHRHITACRDERLIYLAVHNHDTDLSVRFSHIDLASHQRGYPALRDIARGMPVGALVLGHRSMQADLWMPDGTRLALDEAVVIGPDLTRIHTKPRTSGRKIAASFSTPVPMFGSAGQALLTNCTVGVIGVGGIGSLVAEYLARLGVGNLIVVDPDEIEETNLSRVVGATAVDVQQKRSKVAIASRHMDEACPRPHVEAIKGDVAQAAVAAQLRFCDYLVLAADSMRARLVFNAMVHQYLIPGVQLGAKVSSSAEGHLVDAFSVNRAVRPGEGCLWCNGLIDPTRIAIESKTEEQRKAEAYGTEEANPSVITLNAIAAAHATNDFLFYFLGLRNGSELRYEHYHFVQQSAKHVIPRRDAGCAECGRDRLSRFGKGDAISLPCING